MLGALSLKLCDVTKCSVICQDKIVHSKSEPSLQFFRPPLGIVLTPPESALKLCKSLPNEKIASPCLVPIPKQDLYTKLCRVIVSGKLCQSLCLTGLPNHIPLFGILQNLITLPCKKIVNCCCQEDYTLSHCQEITRIPRLEHPVKYKSPNQLHQIINPARSSKGQKVD